MTTTEQDDELLFPREVSAMFRVSYRTVRKWAKAGRFPDDAIIRTLGGHRRYRRRVIDALIEGELNWNLVAAERDAVLTTGEAAHRCSVKDYGTVARWADRGLLPTFRTPGGDRRFYARDVDAFLARREAAAVAEVEALLGDALDAEGST